MKNFATVNNFPNLWQVTKLLVLAFPTCYLAERFLRSGSIVHKAKKQVRYLRLLLTDMKPDVKRIIDDHHAQVHNSP